MQNKFKPKNLILTAGPSISYKEKRYVLDAVKNGWNNHWNDYIKKFEKKFAQYIGVKYALATSGGTGALQLALASLDIKKGDEVILPDPTYFTSSDEFETQRVVELSLQTKKPCYIRLGRVGATSIHKKKINFSVGKGIVLEHGKDICLIATGGIVKTALKLRTELIKANITTTVISMPTIKPIDQKLIVEMAKKHRALFTIEEHSIIGGLGSIVSEIIAEKNISVIFKRIGIPDTITYFVGDQKFMESKHNLSVKEILRTIQKNYA